MENPRIDNKGRFILTPPQERFWDKVNKAGPDDCWLWTGNTQTFGYGVLWASHHLRRIRAHRLSWEIANGRKVPRGKHILHNCDNPPCVNPAHLRLGTAADNHADMVKRGRSPIGEKNPMAKLNHKQVEDIRARFPLRHKTGPRSKEDRLLIARICADHKISPQLAWRIASGERWKI